MNHYRPLPLLGKVALVTGASRGIGRAIAQRFAAEGATVVVSARGLNASQGLQGSLQETVDLIAQDGGVALPVRADLEVPYERESLIARAISVAGGLDILVNNAGYVEYRLVEDMPTAIFERTLCHYLQVPFALSQSAINPMRRRGGGWILNLGSVTALPPVLPYTDFERRGGIAAYAAAKAAINRFTQTLAAELQGDNIAVHSVAPSTAIRTPGADRYIAPSYPTEPVENLVEVALALCLQPAHQCTGLVTHSLHYLQSQHITAHSLDGRTALPPPFIPEWAHPDIVAEGL